MRAFHIERRATYPMNPCPMPGDGVHRWLLGEANSMVARGYSREEIGEALKQLITRKPQKGEIEAAVEKALRDRGRFSRRANATLRNQMPPCPAPGFGVNRWLIIAANQLKRQGVSLSEAEQIILEQMTRPPKGSELRATLRKVYQQSPAQWHSAQTHRKPNKRHELNPYNQTSDPDLIKRAVETGFRQEDLKALSPAIPFPLLSRKRVVRSLFPPGCLVCCAKGREYGYETGPVESFDSFDGFNFIVPQPMTALKGWTQDGKLSPKSKDNTGSWRYFVYESDGLSLDDQAAVLFELAHYLPLALVVFSGNQSLHGWFFVQSLDDVALRRFQCLAVRLGACTGPLNRSQLVRMPGGWNKDVRAKQEVIFFNPGAIRP